MTLIRADRLSGIKHWSQYIGKRRKAVYRYYGSDKNSPMLYFEDVKTGAITMIHKDSLFKNGFIPFLLDFKEINQHIRAIKSR